MGDIFDEYRTINDGAIWHERSTLGRLRVSGADRVAFLQALVSNDVSLLRPGTGIYATYLTPQGRMLADLRLYDRGDHILAVVAANLAQSLSSRLSDLIFAEDAQVSDVSADLTQIVVAGAGAASTLEVALGAEAGRLNDLIPLAQVDIADGFVARSDDAALPSFEVFVAATRRDDVIRSLTAHGARAVASDVVEALRIEAARPAFGADMSNETIPLEAGLLDRAISTTKGCYVGQEIIIRVLHRGGGRVARRLVQLAVDAPDAAVPPAGAEILVEGRESGRVTSATFSPRFGRPIALGYVSRAAAEPGTRVTLTFQGLSLPAEITALAG